MPHSPAQPRSQRNNSAWFRSVSRSGYRLARALEKILGREMLFLLLLATLVGVGGGYGAIVFRWMIGEVGSFSFGGADGLEGIRALPWYWKLLIPAAGGLVVGPLVHWGAREARGHGVPEVMHAAANVGGRIRPRVTLVKALASAICIGTGGSVGREGPIVQIGAAFGSTVAQLLGLDAERRRILLACGAAAGIAGTFNAPIAGVIFASEIILGMGTIRVFGPLVVASVIATSITRLHLGDTPAFQVPAFELVSLGELPLYAVMGFGLGLAAVGFTRALYATEHAWDRVNFPRALSPVLGGLMVGAIALAYPEVYGVGYETISHAITGDPALSLLLMLFVAKAAASIVTLSWGGSGGIFAPSLFLGAMAGGAFGTVANLLWPGAVASPGAYALIGMGAMVAGTTHASLTAILILFEMTDSYSIILPLMLACTIASVLSTRISHGSIYTLKLLRRGDMLKRPTLADYLDQSSTVSVMREDLSSVFPDEPFSRVASLLLGGPESTLYVVTRDGRYEGSIRLTDVKGVITEGETLESIAVALDMMRCDIPTVRLDSSLARCLEIFARTEFTELPVLDEGDRLAGRVTHHDVSEIYNREVLHFGMLGLRFHGQSGSERPSSEATPMYVPLECESRELTVGQPLEGATLRELNLRARYAVDVVGIRDRAGDHQMAPDPARCLEADDVLIMIGNHDALDLVTAVFEARSGPFQDDARPRIGARIPGSDRV